MAIARVNSGAFFASGSASTIPAPATSLTSGNLLVVGVRSASALTVTGISDTAGNTYTLAATNTLSTVCNEVWYTHATAGNGSNIVTATFSGSGTNRTICTAQYSGATGYLPKLTSMGLLTGTSITHPLTRTSSDCLAMCFGSNGANSAITAGSNYTLVVADASNIGLLLESIVTVSTGLTPSYSTLASTSKVLLGVFFDPTPAGSGGGAATLINSGALVS